MAVLIPRQFARARQIQVGTTIDIESVLVLKPRRPRYKLSELMAGFKPKHRHGEWELGAPVGRKLVAAR